MATKLVGGYWMEYVTTVRNSISRELTEKEISALMKMYISSVSVVDAIKEVK